MTRPLTSRQRDESGATAVLVALLTLVLLGTAAFAIDLGQVYAKRSSLQSTVDLAVLAAAAELDGSTNCTPAALNAAETYLRRNWIDTSKDPISVSLRDSTDDNGVRNDGGLSGDIECNGWHVDLWAPKATVDFGLAEALPGDQADSLEVPAFAAAGIYSPRTATMPAYAVSGCDFGPQTLLDNTPGQSASTPTAPSLPGGATDTDNPGLSISSLSPSVILLNEITGLSIDGANTLDEVTQIAFSTPTSTSNLHITVDPTTVGNGLVTLNQIPDGVIQQEGIWWVRVSRDWTSPDDPATWSNALQLQVGDATLECSATVTAGNFGSLLLYREPDSATNERLALNMALGLDFTMTTYPGAASDWECSEGVDPAVVSTNQELNDGTNCVATDTGLPALATEMGLITGVDDELGRFDVGNPGAGTNSSCTTTNDTIDFGGSTGEITINNDYLTCFFTDGTTTIGSIGASYVGDPVITEEIFDSPRFFWVPVFGKPATPGGADHYQIVDFRPAFITDQPDSATRDNPSLNAGGTQNGIGLAETGNSQTLRSLRVVFFNVEALPDSVAATHPTMNYLGVGPKILSLVE